MTITVTSSELADYPGVAQVLGKAKNDDWSVATRTPLGLLYWSS
jgi:hypothetical protein